MPDTRRLAALATAAALAVTPTAALAATKHTSAATRKARATCVALHKKEGTKKFDARYGKGKKHTGAMKACIAKHMKKKSKSTTG